MPRQKEITVYKFSELPDKAKHRVKLHFMESNGYAWADEALASLRKLAEHFGAKVSAYSIDWFDSTPSSVAFTVPEDVEVADIEAKLDELGTYNPKTLKGLGDCELTGYCMDEDAIDGFRKAWHEGERDLEKLLDAAYASWIESAHEDCKSQYEDEQFSEFCDANEYEFDVNSRSM